MITVPPTRIKKFHSRQEIADALGISRMQLYRYEQTDLLEDGGKGRHVEGITNVRVIDWWLRIHRHTRGIPPGLIIAP